MKKQEVENGQRVQVLLHRGMADTWIPGTVLDWREMKVQLDEDPPGMARIVSESDIADWRPV
jgi:hypothetical protein